VTTHVCYLCVHVLFSGCSSHHILIHVAAPWVKLCHLEDKAVTLSKEKK
jgi:hypothetical protein